MTSDEAAKLFVLIQGTWPRVAEGDVATRLWLEDLMTLDFELARQAWRKLRDTREFAPSWALFCEAYRAESPQRVLAGEPFRPYGEVTYTREGQARIQARLEAARVKRADAAVEQAEEPV